MEAFDIRSQADQSILSRSDLDQNHFQICIQAIPGSGPQVIENAYEGNFFSNFTFAELI